MSQESQTAIFLILVWIPMLLAYGYDNASFSGRRTFDMFRVDGRHAIGFPSDSAAAPRITRAVEDRRVEVCNNS